MPLAPSSSPADSAGKPPSSEGTAANAPTATSPLLDQMHRTLVEALPSPVFCKNKDSVLLYVNRAMAQEIGKKPEDILGKTDLELFPKALAEKYRADDLRVLAGKLPETLEEEFAAGTGRRRIAVTKSPLFNAAGEVVGLMGVITDVTAQKRAFDELQRSEEEFRRVWEESFDGMRITDESGIIVRVNDAFCRMVRKRQEELVGKPFTVIYESDPQGAILTKHRKRFAERNVAQVFERELLLWNGEKVWFELTNSFMEVPGQNTLLLSIFRDVSERKEAEEKLKDFTARLERSNRELQDFAYVASHDLQEPLRKVAVFADRLKVKYAAGLGTEGADYVDRMQKAALRMQTLINDLLSFSRVTSKSQPFVPVDLHKVAQDVMVDLEARIEQVKGKVILGPLPTIDAEPLHMRQLFQNLIGNALKFNRPGVTPQVHVQAFTFRELDTAERSGREMVQLTVSDNGIGFDEKYLERIFQVFQRLHARSEYEGTGMGLAIARKIVEHHKGQVTAKSKPDEGATFIVILPVHQPFASKHSQP